MTAKRPPDTPARVNKGSLVPAAEAAKGRYGDDFPRAMDAALAMTPEDRPRDIESWRLLFGGQEDSATSDTGEVSLQMRLSAPAEEKRGSRI